MDLAAQPSPMTPEIGAGYTVGEKEGNKMLRLFALMAASVVVFGTSAAAQKVQPGAKDATVFSYKIHYLEAAAVRL
jgi:hypothetical protein